MNSASVPEEVVIRGFHALQAASLALARAEGLIDAETLASFDSPDLSIWAPALTLLVGALRAEGDPPAIEIPSLDPSQPAATGTLNILNCPPALQPLLSRWQDLVPRLRAYDQQGIHDICRMLVDLEPEHGIDPEAAVLATALRSLALEIAQRRSFQELFSSDIQAALDYDHDRMGGPARKTSYVPPPTYPNGPPVPARSPRPAVQTAASSSSASSSAELILQAIRETLYAALAEVLTTSSTLLDTLSPSNTEPDAVAARPRAYFASVALSILYVCLSQVDPVSRTVRVVGFGPDHPTAVTEDACPPHLRGIVTALVSIAIAARELRDEDDRGAVERAVEDEYAGRAGQDEETKVEMLKRNLETGSGPDSELSNVIQALALRVTHMPQFADKQSEVFEILCGLRPASPATAKATW